MPVAETVDGRCYVIGGRIRDTASPLASVEVYDPVSDRWQSRSPMPTPRFAHGSAVIDGRIHVVGGGDGSSLFNVHEVYDPATDRWSTLAPLPAGRALIGVTALGETMYVIGGSLGGNAGLLSLFIYDAATDSWSQGANLPSPRFSLQAAALNGRIYAVGGADGFNSVSDVTVYDPASDRWSTVSAMNTRRSRFALAEAGGQLYAIGGTRVFGGNDHEGMDLVERYTPAAAGAPFRINPGLNDAWFNPDTSGQGFFINVFPDTGVLFLAWFTYDTERPPGDLEAVIGEPGHRWLTAAGAFGDTRAVLDVSLTRGGVFDAPMPAAVTDEMPIGTITLEWDDCETATLRYDLETPPRTGEMGIRRVVADNIALCEALSAPPGSAADRR